MGLPRVRTKPTPSTAELSLMPVSHPPLISYPAPNHRTVLHGGAAMSNGASTDWLQVIGIVVCVLSLVFVAAIVFEIVRLSVH